MEYPRSVRLGTHIGINRDCFINGRGGFHVEDWVLVGPRVIIDTQNHDVAAVGVPLAMAPDVRAPVTIRRDAWIGVGACVLPGVTIGVEAVIAAGAGVTRDVPERAIVAGVPAVVQRVREPGMA